MTVALHSYKIDRDGKITVRHTFYAATEDEAEDLMDQHADGCAAYGPALDKGDTIEIFEEVPAPPDPEELAAVAEAQLEDEDEDEEDPDAEEVEDEDQ